MAQKTIPTALKELKGNPGKRPLPKNEVKYSAAIPVCPSHLDKLARAEWKRMAAELKPLGLLTKADRAAFAVYCAMWSRWVQAEQKIAETGYAYTTRDAAGQPKAIIQSPYIGIANRAAEIMHKFLTEFGFTPSSKTRVSAPPENKLAKFLSQPTPKKPELPPPAPIEPPPTIN
jgi:P27 family predicted phage terminase small subunit